MIVRLSLNIVLMVSFMIILSLSVNAQTQTRQSRELSKIHQKIEKRYPELSHLSGSELVARSDEDILLFDVRKPSEFAVSHLEGAVQIDPSMSGAAFVSKYGDVIKGKTLVFYCSVGRRSSAMANRVTTEVAPQTLLEVYNLEGGIFRWHNNNLPLIVDDKNAGEASDTDNVHPFNAFWSRLIEDREAIRYKP